MRRTPRIRPQFIIKCRCPEMTARAHLSGSNTHTETCLVQVCRIRSSGCIHGNQPGEIINLFLARLVRVLRMARCIWWAVSPSHGRCNHHCQITDPVRPVRQAFTVVAFAAAPYTSSDKACRHMKMPPPPHCAMNQFAASSLVDHGTAG